VYQKRPPPQGISSKVQPFRQILDRNKYRAEVPRGSFLSTNLIVYERVTGKNCYGILKIENGSNTYGPSRFAKTPVMSSTSCATESSENNFAPSFSSGITYLTGYKVRDPYG